MVWCHTEAGIFLVELAHRERISATFDSQHNTCFKEMYLKTSSTKSDLVLLITALNVAAYAYITLNQVL